MKRLIRALKRYASREEYIVSYTIDVLRSKDKLDFYFQTINSKEDYVHQMAVTHIPKRVDKAYIDRVIKALYNEVRELEKRGK